MNDLTARVGKCPFCSGTKMLLVLEAIRAGGGGIIQRTSGEYYCLGCTRVLAGDDLWRRDEASRLEAELQALKARIAAIQSEPTKNVERSEPPNARR